MDNLVTPNQSPWIATPIPTPTVAPVTEMPIAKKSKVPAILLGLIALVIIAGIGGITFMLSRGVNSQNAVAPNAPDSEPKAFEPFDPMGTIDCSNEPNTAPYGNRCIPTMTDPDGNVIWVNDPNNDPNLQ